MITDIEGKVRVKNKGFIVSDKQYFNSWKNEVEDSVLKTSKFLKEWNLQPTQIDYDLNVLKEYENKLNVKEGLFSTIVADRRLFFNKHYSYSVSYTRRYNDDQLLTILQKNLVEVESF